MIYVQSGRNDKYPKQIETWRKGESLPSWISDNCKIIGMEGTNLIPEIRGVHGGGYEIVRENGSALVSTKNEKDYICLGDGKIFSLTEKQLNLLYKILIGENKKNKQL